MPAPKPPPMELADLAAAAAGYGVSTMFEANGRTGLIDLELIAHLPEAKVAGPARTVYCGQDDNLMVPAAIAYARPGDILVMRMPRSRPVSLLGELLATQCLARGVAGVLVDAAIRDAVAIRALGLPVWSRYIRARSAAKTQVGELDIPLEFGGTTVAPGDLIVLDGDGALAIAADRIAAVVAAAAKRDELEAIKRKRFASGELSYDLDGLRALVEGQSGSGTRAAAQTSAPGYSFRMHIDDESAAALEEARDEDDSASESEREREEKRAAALDEEDAERRGAVNAADDTGLVQQQERLHVVEVPGHEDEADGESGEEGSPA